MVLAVLWGFGGAVGRRVGARLWRLPEATARATLAVWRRVEDVVVLTPRRRVYDLAYAAAREPWRVGGGGGLDDLDGRTVAETVRVGYVRLDEREREKDVRAGGAYVGRGRVGDGGRGGAVGRRRDWRRMR